MAIKRMSIRVDETMHRKLAALATVKKTSVQELVVSYLRDGTKRDNGDAAIKEAARTEIERIRREAGLND